jgi:hypothetical protein
MVLPHNTTVTVPYVLLLALGYFIIVRLHTTNHNHKPFTIYLYYNYCAFAKFQTITISTSFDDWHTYGYRSNSLVVTARTLKQLGMVVSNFINSKVSVKIITDMIYLR